MHSSPLHPTLVQHFEKLRSGAGVAYVLDLPGRKQAYLNPAGPQDQAALLHALGLRCPGARRGPSQ